MKDTTTETFKHGIAKQMLCDVLIRVFCGISIEDNCEKQLHPLNEVKKAKKIIDLNKSIDCYSNSSDFISTVKYYGLKKGVKTEFYIDGKICDDDIEPIFESLNKSFDLIDELCSNIA